MRVLLALGGNAMTNAQGGYRITGIPEIFEIDTFYCFTVFYIEAGNNSFCQHQRIIFFKSLNSILPS